MADASQPDAAAGFLCNETLRELRAAALLEWLQVQPKNEIGFREILRLGPSAMRTKEVAEEALSILASHGWVVEISRRPRVIRLFCGASGQ